VVRPPGVEIAFLQMDDVGLCTGQKLDNPLELQTAIDVPIHDPDGTGWTKNPPGIEHHGPVISRVPGTKVWLAYGHYRNGILLTPATAHLVPGEILGYPKQIAGDWLKPVGYGRSPEQRVGIS
jgi:hypothetical protein